MKYEKIVEHAKKNAANIKSKENVAIQIDITGEGEGAFYVAVKDGKVEVAPYEYYEHDAKVIADGKDFVAFLDGKADESVLNIQGDAAKAEILKEMVVKSAAKAAAKPAAKPAEKKAAPAKKPAAKPAEKKAEAPKAAAKPAAKPAEKKAEAPKAAAKPAAKPAVKKPAAKKPTAKKK